MKMKVCLIAVVFMSLISLLIARECVAPDGLYDPKLSEEIVSWMTGSKMAKNITEIRLYYTRNLGDPKYPIDFRSKEPIVVIKERKGITRFCEAMWSGRASIAEAPVTAKGVVSIVLFFEREQKPAYLVSPLGGSMACFLTPMITHDSAYFRAYGLFDFLIEEYPKLDEIFH